MNHAAFEVSAFAHPSALPPDARHCLELAERRNAGFGFAWYANLADTVYPGDPHLRFYVLRQHGQVLAILPLRGERARFGWRVAALANFYTSLYEPVLAPCLSPAALAVLLAAVERDFPRMASLTLAPMDPASQAYQTLMAALRARGWPAFAFFSFGNWYQRIDQSWPDYLAERSSQVQNTIRRMGKKFANAGGTLQLMTEMQDMPAAIAAWNKVYSESWKKPEPYPDFMPGLLRLCALQGYLRMGIAWMDGKPVAAQLWIVSHGRAEIYKLAYDEAFKAYGPGTLLSAKLMEYAIETDKVVEVDYLIGDDPYKKTWMNQRRERFGIVAYNPRSLSGMAGLLKETAARALKTLRRRRGQKAQPGTA